MIGAVIGVGGAWLLAFFTGAWVFSGRMARLEQKVADLPKTLNSDVVRPHEDRCINFATVRAEPTNPGLEMLT